LWRVGNWIPTRDCNFVPTLGDCEGFFRAPLFNLKKLCVMKISENLSITFLVEKPEMSKDGRVPVIVRVTLNGQRTEISLGARIFPEQWDKISGRVKGKSPDALLLNNQITQTKAKLEKHFFLLTTQHEFVTADMIRKSYKGKLVMSGNPDEPDEKKTFMQAVAFEIGRLKEKHEKGLRAKSTITKWESTRTKLEAFVLYTYKKADIPMEIIRPNFAEDMLHYFMVEEDLDHNAAMKYIQNTKQVLTTATGRWIKSNPIRDFRCSFKQPERDVLTIQEIWKIYKKVPDQADGPGEGCFPV
jgi:hypothetical protein